MSKIGYFFWHFMLFALLLLSLNYAKNYALFAGKCQQKANIFLDHSVILVYPTSTVDITEGNKEEEQEKVPTVYRFWFCQAAWNYYSLQKEEHEKKKKKKKKKNMRRRRRRRRT